VLSYERVGRGPALALLHPLGADRHLFAPLVPHLREHRELILIDLPGFGDSPPLADAQPTARALAAAVATLLAELGLERSHVAGISLGGWVALELGLLGATRSVTAIAPAGLWAAPLVPKPSGAHLLGGRFLPLVGAAAATAVGRRLLLRSAVAHPSRVPGPEATHLVRAYARAPGFIPVNNAMRASRFEGLERIRVPLTLVWPDHDRLVSRPPWLPDNVRNVILDDAGHIPVWDRPEAVAQILLAASATSGDSASARAGQPGRVPAGAAQHSRDGKADEQAHRRGQEQGVMDGAGSERAGESDPGQPRSDRRAEQATD
jgi:pimeloyl-ACP methyl ester carboxylesterase